MDEIKKRQSSVADAPNLPPTLVANIDEVAEKCLRRKQDIMLLPALALLYLFMALDKGNLSNSKNDGVEKDLHLRGNQYYLTVTIFYVPLCLFGTPLSILAKRFSAARIIPLMMLGHGICSILIAVAKNFGALFALRFLTGICESPLLPSVVYYLSSFYTRGELALRVGLFYAAASLSGALSGLIAYGVFQLRASRLHGWQYLFLIEGAGTIVIALFAFFWLPKSPAECWFFNKADKELSRNRLLRDGTNEINERIDIRDACMPFLKDWRYCVWGLLAIGLGVPLASVGNFLPQFVARLGYSQTKTVLYTIAPNVVGAIFLILITQRSDYCRDRGLHIVATLLTTMTGFILLACTDTRSSSGVTYFTCFLLCIGCNVPSVLLSTWYSNNTISENQRVVLTGVMVGIANAAGLISGSIFRAQDEPRYIPGLETSAAFGGATAIGAFVFAAYMRMENIRRNKTQELPRNHGSQDVPTELLTKGVKNPAFRFFL